MAKAEGMQLPRRIFTFWTGSNAMSDARRHGLDSMAATGCEIILVTPETLAPWLVPGAPLPDTYDALSVVHRSDYLRAYFMHHHGGGYSDIKPTSQSWLPAFEVLEASDAFGIGYREISPKGVAHVHRHRLAGALRSGVRARGWPESYLHYRRMRWAYRSLIGNGAYIFRPGTMFTAEWLATVTGRLELVREALMANPARIAREASDSLIDGRLTGYPLPWSGICADVLHPLVFRHRSRILQGLPPPGFRDYQ